MPLGEMRIPDEDDEPNDKQARTGRRRFFALIVLALILGVVSGVFDRPLVWLVDQPLALMTWALLLTIALVVLFISCVLLMFGGRWPRKKQEDLDYDPPECDQAGQCVQYPQNATCRLCKPELAKSKEV